MWKKGESGNPKGRPKGARDKFTDLKNSFLTVYQELGGDEYLKEFAKENPRDFVKLLGSMLPKDVQTEIKNNITISWQQPPGQIPDAEVITPQLAEPDTHNVTEHD